MHYTDDGTPIYLQLVRRIKAEIASGTLPMGARMPSVRDAAENYRVNPNTMQRVMAELEREGVIAAQRGVGFFVTDDPGLVAGLRHAEAARALARFLADMAALGLRRPDIAALFDTAGEGDQP